MAVKGVVHNMLVRPMPEKSMAVRLRLKPKSMVVWLKQKLKNMVAMSMVEIK